MFDFGVNINTNIFTFTRTNKKAALINKSFHIEVTGLVQGVGFRPFVFRIATGFNLTGWVQNTNENIKIVVSGNEEKIKLFIETIRQEAPPAAIIDEISSKEIDLIDFKLFTIKKSDNISENITEISPDIAVCSECLQDIEEDGTRYIYPFVNCTNCGPRFTIIKDLPYDRAKTTMQSFIMCPDCRKEYETITDRRFHAQPTACSHCGPHYELFSGLEKVSENTVEIVNYVCQCIEDGGVVLIKGLGGMHLACDAFNEKAVMKLRRIKNRDGKPFAVMFRDFETLRHYTEINNQEEKSLMSWRKPIVLLEKKKIAIMPELSDPLNAGLAVVGVMLPYMPLHRLIFNRLKTSAIVLTSGNFSSEPILIDNTVALEQFSPHVTATLLYNRDIYNRTDDSVVRIIGGLERVLRRSRGYVPAPVKTSLNMEGIMAFGAELTNCFCVGKGHKAFLSQHIGDLQGIETALFYEDTIARFIKLFRIVPTLLAVDMHPGYISTKTGLNYGDLPVVAVQHHHAHIASCMTEHNLDEKVIGIALDGTGYGEDGNTWGSEFMVCDLADFERITHFEYLPMPGGDMAAEEPWRMAVSYLFKVYGEGFNDLELPVLEQVEPDKISMIMRMIERKINCPLTSGAGRLFDCVASLLGLVQIATFQAEGPMRLESSVVLGCNENYPFKFDEPISFDDTIRAIVSDIKTEINPSIIATKFHNTIILVIFEFANSIRLKLGLNKVVLSGGVFQNKYLLEGAIHILQKNNFEVYSHSAVPANDGGIALGQLAVASKRRELKCV